MIPVYILIVLIAALAGSVTGMGGGVIMKPLMDLLGDFDAQTIGLLCCITVLAMALMSCIRQIGAKQSTKISSLLLLGAGSACGGFLGQFLFELLVTSADDVRIKTIQNCVICAIVLLIFIFMLYKSRIKTLQLKNPVFYILTGILLGVISAFLGIGGGPLNVAILMLLFSMDIKNAAFGSIITILFAQVFKFATILITEIAESRFFVNYDLSVLPYMIVAALIGAFIGNLLKKKMSAKAVALCFNVMQIIIIGICITNIAILNL